MLNYMPDLKEQTKKAFIWPFISWCSYLIACFSSSPTPHPVLSFTSTSDSVLCLYTVLLYSFYICFFTSCLSPTSLSLSHPFFSRTFNLYSSFSFFILVSSFFLTLLESSRLFVLSNHLSWHSHPHLFKYHPFPFYRGERRQVRGRHKQ